MFFAFYGDRRTVFSTICVLVLSRTRLSPTLYNYLVPVPILLRSEYLSLNFTPVTFFVRGNLSYATYTDTGNFHGKNTIYLSHLGSFRWI